MKSTKNILFGLAGAWVLILFIEKMTGTAGRLQASRRAFPIRWVWYLFRFIKSTLMFGLAVMNVFMAISLVDEDESCS
ncbi:MAG: hypothetical protein ACOC41_06600 [Chitinivibrionales bacterium]